MKGEPPRQHTIIPAPIAVHTLTPASGATANVHSPAGTSTETGQVRKPDRYGNQMGAKNAPMQKVHRCRLCTRTCPACRRSCLAAASSSLTQVKMDPVQNDPRQFAGDTSCILQPVAFCNCCSTTKRKPLTSSQLVGGTMGGIVCNDDTAPSLTKQEDFCNDYVSLYLCGTLPCVVPDRRCGLLVQREPLRRWARWNRP